MSKRFLPILASLFVLAAVFAFSGSAGAVPDKDVRAQQGGLPDIRFLGEGPGTFTVDGPGRELLVKTYEGGSWSFVTHTEESYFAQTRERVWSTDFLPGDAVALQDAWQSFGQVPAGCTVYYVQIEDNIDDRINSFYLDNTLIQNVEQGWVTYGSLVTPAAGELRFYAADSVGIIVTPCQVQPTEEVTPTFTASVPANTPTATVTEAVPTATGTITSEVPGSTPTFTATVPGATEQPTRETTTVPGDEDTPTPAAVTPVTTPGLIPVSGSGPGPGESALIGIALLGSLAFTASALWRMALRTRRGG